MARQRGNNEFNPRHRIIGAVILVTALVVLVPMILNRDEPPPPGAVPDEARPATRIEVTPLAPVTEPELPAVRKEPAVEPESSHPAAATDTAPPPVDKRPPATTARTPASAPAPTVDKGWVLQLGTYARQENVERLSKKLKKSGYSVLLVETTIKTGKATRVRVGPYADKADAEAVQARIQSELGIKGAVLAYP